MEIWFLELSSDRHEFDMGMFAYYITKNGHFSKKEFYLDPSSLIRYLKVARGYQHYIWSHLIQESRKITFCHIQHFLKFTIPDDIDSWHAIKMIFASKIDKIKNLHALMPQDFPSIKIFTDLTTQIDFTWMMSKLFMSTFQEMIRQSPLSHLAQINILACVIFTTNNV